MLKPYYRRGTAIVHRERGVIQVDDTVEDAIESVRLLNKHSEEAECQNCRGTGLADPLEKNQDDLCLMCDGTGFVKRLLRCTCPDNSFLLAAGGQCEYCKNKAG